MSKYSKVVVVVEQLIARRTCLHVIVHSQYHTWYNSSNRSPDFSRVGILVINVYSQMPFLLAFLLGPNCFSSRKSAKYKKVMASALK